VHALVNGRATTLQNMEVTKMVALLVLMTILVFMTVDYLVRRPATTRATAPQLNIVERLIQRTPLGVFFHPGHSWLYLEPSGMAKVGVDDFAHSVIGEIDAAETLPVGEQVRKGDVIVKLRHGDRTAAIRSPMDGVIKSVNTELLSRSTWFGAEPYTSAWLYRIEPRESSELPRSLYLGEAATRWFNHEVERLGVFLGTITPANAVVGRTLPDGGLPTWQIVDHLSDGEWNKCQEIFFGTQAPSSGRSEAETGAGANA